MNKWTAITPSTHMVMQGESMTDLITSLKSSVARLEDLVEVGCIIINPDGDIYYPYVTFGMKDEPHLSWRVR